MANLDVTTSGAHLAQGLVTPTGGGADKTLADIAAQSHEAVTLAGTPDYVTLSGQQITRNSVNLASHVTGNLPVSRLNGGASASSSTYWCGDNTWSTPTISSLNAIGDVTYSGSPSDNQALVWSSGAWRNSTIASPEGSGTAVDTIALMQAIAAPVDKQLVAVRGYHTPGDGGGGTFMWSAASAATANNGTIFTGVGSGRWMRATNGNDVSVKWFGARGDGVTEDQFAFDQAIRASNSIYVPAGTYFFGAMVDVASVNDKRIFGAPNAILTASTSMPFFRIRNGWSVEGLTFKNTLTTGSPSGISIYPQGVTNVLVRSCQFYFSAQYAYAITNTNYGADIDVIDCKFYGQGGSRMNGVWLNRVTNSRVINCFFKNVDIAIRMYGGAQFCVIANNVVDTGRVGINFLHKRGAGPYNIGFYHNIVSNNVVRNIYEEGIGFDSSHASDAWPELNPSTPLTYASSATVGGKRRITLSETGQAAGWASDGSYHVVFLSGGSRGFVSRILDSGDGWLDVSMAANFWNSASAGDKILITLGTFWNVIEGNSVERCQTLNITLWGSAWWNIIRGNTVRAHTEASGGGGIGISVFSVLHPVMTGSPGEGQNCYSGFNLVENNTVSLLGDYADVGGAPILVETRMYSAVPDITASNLTPGCVVRGNMISSGNIVVKDAADCLVEQNFLSGCGTIAIQGAAPGLIDYRNSGELI